ncbi:hypothetical protein A3K63_00650 [Candidatus Micrarchaeota archaeon RBG_16_49_10]|nr:MAG: hypothetical protein A3K63_00650 [Candidatus Micrarchaeota archaeon RBG_16_49_10]
MAKGAYHFIGEAWKNPKKKLKKLYREKLISLRAGEGFEKIPKPTRLDKARALGYKAKKGFSVVRARIKRGGRRRPLFGRKGRKPSKMGLVGFTHSMPRQSIAEERANSKYPNLEVLGSYKIGEDGQHEWFEIILVDPSAGEIKKDKNLGWISENKHRRRVYRGLTTSTRKSRNL